MSTSATSIYQAFLDEMSDALLAFHTNTFLRRVFRPHLIVTETQVINVVTDEEARLHFKGFADALKAQGVDAYVRTVREAWFEGDTDLVGRHDSYMMSHGKLVVPRYANESRLVLRDGVWGSTETRHFTRFVSWPDILPRSEQP